MQPKAVFQLGAMVSLVASSLAMAQPNSSGPFEREDFFGPVFAIMNAERGPDSMGCRGCHIGPEAFIPWGDARDEVLQTLEDRDPATGEVRGLVSGGREGQLAQLLHGGQMPYGGVQWSQVELDLLDAWLTTYESAAIQYNAQASAL